MRSSTAILWSGILTLIFGLVALFSPVNTALVMVVIVGGFMVVSGVMEAVLGFRAPRGQRGWGVVSGILTAIVGLIALFSPDSAATVVVWIVALWLIVRGILNFVAAFSGLGARGGNVIAGILWILLAVLLLNRPAVGAAALSIFIGILAVVGGVSLIAAGLLMRRVGNSLRDAQNPYLKYHPEAQQQGRSELDNGDVIDGEVR